jgi:hypothetical protein
MLVRITAGQGVGTIVDLIPAVARARIAGGTAEEVKEERIETTTLKRGDREIVGNRREATKRRA